MPGTDLFEALRMVAVIHWNDIPKASHPPLERRVHTLSRQPRANRQAPWEPAVGRFLLAAVSSAPPLSGAQRPGGLVPFWAGHWDAQDTRGPQGAAIRNQATPRDLRGASPVAGNLCLGRGHQCVLPARTDCVLWPPPREGTLLAVPSAPLPGRPLLARCCHTQW